jgi:hypothetical protein
VTPTIVVAQTRDGIWNAHERTPGRIALAYFPTKFAAIKHAIRTAKVKLHCRVVIRNLTGADTASREYQRHDDIHGGG